MPTLIMVLRDLLRPEAVARLWLARHLAAQRVDRGAGSKEDRLEVGAAKGEVGRYLRGADDAEPRAVRREHPGPARAGTVNPTVDIDLHAVGHTIGLLRRHVGEDPSPHHVARPVEFDGVDVLGVA